MLERDDRAVTAANCLYLATQTAASDRPGAVAVLAVSAEDDDDIALPGGTPLW